MFQRLKGGGWPYSQPPSVPFEKNEASEQARGLVGWWPTLGSRGANVLRDFGERGLDGTFPGGTADPSWVGDGRFGSVLSFDGANDYIDAGDIDAVEGISQITISARVYFKSAPDYGQAVASKGIYYNSAASWYFGPSAYLPTDRFGWSISNLAWNYVGGISSRTGVWQLVTWVYDKDNTRAEIWQDGSIKASGRYGSWVDIPATDISCLIGKSSTYELNFLLSDLRIHNVALSPAVIWGMAHDKKWELYRPVRRVWAVKGEMFQAAWAMRANRLIGGGLRV